MLAQEMPREKGRKRKARAGLSEFEEVKRLVEKCQSGTGNKNVNSGAGRPIDEKALQRIRTSGMEVLRLLAGPASSISIGIFFSSLVRIARFRRWATTINQLIFKGLVDLALAIDEDEHGDARRARAQWEARRDAGEDPGAAPHPAPRPLKACHEALANPAAVYREDPENEAFTRIRSKPEIVEKYGTGRVSHNSMPALKQVTAALEQIGAKSDVPNHRLLNRGDRSHSSGEEYPEVDELGATAFKVRVDKVQEPNAQGIMEEVEQEVELVANTENRFLNQMSTTLKAKLHMFPAMTREENGYRSVRDSVAEIATAVRGARASSPAVRAYVEVLARLPPNDGDLACTARQGLGACTVACEVRRLDDVTPEAIMHILKSFKNLEWDHWPVPIMTLVAGVVHAIVELSDPAYQMNARTTAGSTFKAKCRVDRVLEVLFSPRWGRVVCSGHHLRDPTACAPFVAASTEWFRAPRAGHPDIFANEEQAKGLLQRCKAFVGLQIA
eukprot:tig00020849_g14661.t1